MSAGARTSALDARRRRARSRLLWQGVGAAVAVGLALAALFVPGVVRGALFLVAGLVATVTGSPRWLGVLLVTAGVPILLVALVTGTVWFG